MALSKLALKAFLILVVAVSARLAGHAHAVPLKRALVPDAEEMTGGSPPPPPPAGEDDDEKALLPLIIRIVAAKAAPPPTCFPAIAKHCGFQLSMQCIKEAVAKSKCAGN
ncbi:hypothetical protein BS78_04G035600 [Paspalum vaginatum]|uniref:Prolamin-like domain-containing protein n=1 Tax=Paspalum vaginatum TaxID=158149 RepID=A0A9W7XBN1_9POAL|nr:hypothetical protein BS78_K183400 [Paspalum vaginatum]KAJ1277860.1 hypothetical protein BS78_04G035600 [Paspalum vaginatum]